MKMLDYPRTIDPSQTFEALVQWFHDEMIANKKAPGFIVGLSGTDSLVAFCAAYKAFEKAGKAHRVLGVHFAPSEDFVDDHPEAEVHLWFQNKILPWLREFAPHAEIVVDTSIDWRHDGLRWGSLMDLSVVLNKKKRIMRFPEDQYWVVGTRNRTEDTLLNYSNASTAASLQPLIHFWKNEILQISEHLGVPKLAIDKSCETDCICGRDRLAAQHIRDIDSLLMVRCGELSLNYVESMPKDLYLPLWKYVENTIAKNSFKNNIPYTPLQSVVHNNGLILGFESGTLNLKEFNHRKHMEIAWFYLKDMNLEAAVERYVHYLKPLLDSAGQSHRFNLELTEAYFDRLALAMHQHPTDNFDDLVAKAPEVLAKISA